MYTTHAYGVGEAPAEPSMWDSFLKLGTSAVTTGFNIYNRVTTLTQQQKATADAKAQAAQMAQYSATYAQQQQALALQNPGIMGSMGGWTVPLLIGGAALVGFMVLKRK